MQRHLATDFTHNYLKTNLEDNDKGEDILNGKLNEKVIDMEWVTAIEDTLPYIEKAIDEQRRFIVENNEVYRIDKAKIINKDSVKHLIQHTNFIDNIDETGKVTPNKVLTIEREDSFETYENRFLITLIENALNFVADKYRKMVDAPTDTYSEVKMDRDLVLNNQHIVFKVEYSNEVKDAAESDLSIKDYEKLSDFDRVRRIRNKLNSLLNTEMMQTLKKCVRVKPPINRTNLMTKNPNYKAGLDLFTYLNAYNKRGFEIVGREFSGSMDKDVQDGLYFSLGFQHFMLSIATNPALKNLLEERYQEQKARRESGQDSETEEIIEKIRKEEMKIRLAEIREREKIIRDQKAEIAALKREIEKRDRTIESLKSSIRALEDQVKQLQNELQTVKAELVKAKERIKELEAKVAELEARIAELEAQVAELEAKVAELEKIKAELEAKIAELEQIIEEQKARIAELEEIVAQQKARIEELEAYVAELEATKAQLEARVESLEAENAAQKATIEAHEATIAQQKDAIASLEAEISGAKQQISDLTETLAQRDATIAENERQISNLTERNNTLSETLETERAQNQEREAQMKADFEAKTEQAAKAHAAELKSMQKTIDDSDAAHAQMVAKLNADFADKTNAAEQKRIKDLAAQQKEFEKQLTTIKKKNTAASAAVDAKHASEIKKVQKSVDKRVADVQKDAEKRMNAKIKDAEKNAKSEIRTAKDALRAVKSSADLIVRDYNYGSMSVVAAYAQQAADAGVTDLTGALIDASRKVKAVAVTKVGKGVSLSVYSNKGFADVKLYKKSTSLDVALADVGAQLAGISEKPVCVTYSGVDKSVAEGFAAQAKSAGADRVTVSENLSLNSHGMVAIYFCKE